MQLSFEAPESEISCERIREYPTELAILTAIKNETLSGWNDFLKRCQVFMNSEFKILFELAQTNQWENLEELLKQEGIEAKRVKEINKILERKKNKNEILDVWHEIESFLKIDPKKGDKQDYYFKAKKLKELLETKSYIFTQKLGRVVLAIKMDNSAWADKELEDFLNFHPARIAFELHRDVFNNNWTRERFEKLMLDIGLVVGNFFKKHDPLLTDIFMTLMDESLNSRTFRSLSSGHQTQWSLSRLRESLASGQRVSAFPSFWYGQLSHRTSRGQVDVLINSLFEDKVVGQLDVESLWIFTENMPSEQKKRERIVEVILQGDMQDPYQKFITLELIENVGFKKLLSKKKPEWEKPKFQLKRSVYKELFYKNSAPELMLFYLLELGDYDRDYLWQFVSPGGYGD